MKDMLTAVIVMAVIILVQVILSFTVNYHVAEVFSNVSWIVLFFHYMHKSINAKMKTVK